MAAALLSVAISVSAKPLVVCTEASPEGFDPVLYTTAVTADAAAETMFNRLVDFKPGTTEVVPALAKTWEISDDGLTYTFHLRDDVKFHTTDYFKPTRNMNVERDGGDQAELTDVAVSLVGAGTVSHVGTTNGGGLGRTAAGSLR